MLEDVKAADEDHILALEEEFRDLTMAEAELYDQLVQVRTTKQGIRRLVAEKKNRYAPIFVLPDELLVAIVETAQQPTGAPVEIIASQISQRFRWAVLGASYLWSSIELRWGGRSDAERFAAYLERSRTCTVSVRLKYASYHGEVECDYEEVPDELDTIAHHISRIRRLVVHCGGTGLTLLDVVSHFCELHAPSLEYVEMCLHLSELDNWDEDVSFFNGGAPRLTTLKLNNIHLDIDPLGNPWLSSITTLDLRGVEYPSLLSLCPQLVDVTLDDSTFSAFVGVKISTPFLRSLRALCLRSEWPDNLTRGILDSLDAPALEKVEFSGVHGGSQISAFFNSPPKFPTLKSLTFANSDIECRGCHLHPERIQPETLRAFSALTSLTILNACSLPRLLEDLLAMSAGTADAGSPCSALPALHTLTLRYKDFDEFGVSNWPPLAAVPFPVNDPMIDLRNRLASLRALRPIHLRLPRSRFFTDAGDWARDDPNLEIFDAEPLLQALGHDA